MSTARDRTALGDPEAQPASPRRLSNVLRLLPWAVLLAIVVFALLLTGDNRRAAVLGIVQGLGEFLPISSSAHLIIVPWLFRWDTPGSFLNSQTYDVALHMGTLLALLGFFWRDWLSLVRHAHQPRSEQGRLLWLLVVASVPGAAIGFVLDRIAEDYFRDKYLIIAAALVVMGVVLYVVDGRAQSDDGIGQISWRKALLIGFAQTLAFVPGVSRSGSTMTMGRALGLSRETAARFAFLMATPITAGAGLLKFGDLELAALGYASFWLGIGVSFVVGLLAIGFLLSYLKRNSFLPFVMYRIALGAIIATAYVAGR
ncbi:MAG: undecaprenyl-diphosphate phosphatase [Chloroflexota bacterium]|nr:undecaprenyl-diphosphate phosphatase [Chloroflexota bacterium]